MKTIVTVLALLFVATPSYADREKKEEHPSIGNQYRGGVGSVTTPGGGTTAAPGTPIPGSTTLKESTVGSFLPRFQADSIQFNVSPETAVPNYACGKWDYPGSSGSRSLCLVQTTSRAPASPLSATVEVAATADGPWSNQLVLPFAATAYFRVSSTGASRCTLSNFVNFTGTSIPPTAFSPEEPTTTFNLTCYNAGNTQTAESTATIYVGTPPPPPSPRPGGQLIIQCPNSHPGFPDMHGSAIVSVQTSAGDSTSVLCGPGNTVAFNKNFTTPTTANIRLTTSPGSVFRYWVISEPCRQFGSLGQRTQSSTNFTWTVNNVCSPQLIVHTRGTSITSSAVGGGSVSRADQYGDMRWDCDQGGTASGSCTNSVEQGNEYYRYVHLVAQPAAGKRLLSWSSECRNTNVNGGQPWTSGPDCWVSPDRAKTVTATFGPR